MGAAVIIAARSTEFVPVKVAALVHVLAWGLWLGSNVWTTFAVGITMFKNMPVRSESCTAARAVRPSIHASQHLPAVFICMSRLAMM